MFFRLIWNPSTITDLFSSEIGHFNDLPVTHQRKSLKILYQNWYRSQYKLYSWPLVCFKVCKSFIFSIASNLMSFSLEFYWAGFVANLEKIGCILNRKQIKNSSSTIFRHWTLINFESLIYLTTHLNKTDKC